MKKVLTYEIGVAESTLTIEQFLRQNRYSHHITAYLKRTDQGICLNGRRAYTNQRLSCGDLLTVTLIENSSSPHIIPTPMDLNIVYEDEDIMILDKPSGTPIHPSKNHQEQTLANGLAWYFGQQGIPFVFRCINRLDRDTTGILIVAKHMLSAAILAERIADREISREYLAIVDGDLTGSGIIDAPIARSETSKIERCVNFAAGERAITHYRSLAQKNGCTLVSLKLETGRTHQIRVHMKHLGYPLAGDTLYNQSAAVCSRINRQALHSHTLTFTHPLTGEPLCFRSDLPADMQWIL